jgi:Protein of unknown function (DUF2490)
MLKTLFTLLLCLQGIGIAAQATRQLNYHTQSWYAVNSTLRVSERWGVVCDFHTRHDGLADREYFYLLRIGGIYWIQKKYPVLAGVAMQWVAPAPGASAWVTENRVYQQWASLTEEGRFAVMQRIRVEQRWRDQVVNDQVVGEKQFTLRLRYLATFQINVIRSL